MPYFIGEGIRDVYEIVRARAITGKEAKKIEGEDAVDDMRLEFGLRFTHRLFEEYRQIDSHKMINHAFVDTAFDEIDSLILEQKDL